MTNLDETLGATLLGAAVSAGLYGLALAQLYSFALSGYKTAPVLKWLAALIGLLDAAHTVLLWGWMYQILVTNYGNIMAMINVQWPLAASFMSFFALDGVVQAFFSYRVYMVSGHWWLAVPLWTLELITLGVHTGMVVSAIKSDGILDFAKHYNGLLYAAMSLSITTSFGNTIVLCWYLRKMDSGITRTRKAMKKLILLTCETGGLQAAMALIVAILWFTKPLASYWLAAYTIHAKVYSNSLLATLNARSHIRDILNEPMSIELPPRIFSPPRSGDGGSSQGSIVFAKRVDVTESQPQDVRIHHDPNYDFQAKSVYTSSTL